MQDQDPASSSESPQVIQTDSHAKNGQTKCPKCGSTDISLNQRNGLLRCNYCRTEFEPVKLTGMVEDLTKLEGQVIASGAQNIVASTDEVLTFKCTSCGAEVVIDTASASQARCHWCRNTLSVNEQMPNGAIPDAVLPFCVSKDDAKKAIEEFVGKRKFFAHPKFKQEFTTENIMGVYFPYLVIDANAHVYLRGQGEHQVRSYTQGSGNNTRTYYDADLYDVERDFDLVINGLTIESSSERRNRNSDKTNNIINAIMPFDTEQCVFYDANYLKGYTSERRDTDIDDLRNLVDTQSKDVARYAANDSLQAYDRGVKWSEEVVNTKGQQWKAAYLPVWLYSYQQVKGDKKVLHYVAVNARTKKTMGSIPLYLPKLIGMSILVEIASFFAVYYIKFDYNYILLSAGIIYFLVFYCKYRNASARHTYEKDTKTSITNLKKKDNFVRRLTKLTSSRMSGANNTVVKGQSLDNKILDTFAGVNGQNIVQELSKNNSAIKFINKFK